MAMECYEDSDLSMRQIVMMFKAVDPKQLSDPGPQLQKVLDFKGRVEQEKEHLFHSFDTIEFFCELLRRHLGQWLRDYEAGETGRVEKPTPPPSGAGSEGMEVEALLESAASMALDSFISDAWSLADEGRLSEAEVEFSKAIVGGNDPAAFIEYGRYLVRGGRLDQAMVMFERARAISEEQGEEAGMASAYGSLGNVLWTQSELDGAEEMYRTSLEAWQKLGVPHRVAQVQGLLDSLRDQDDPSTSSG